MTSSIVRDLLFWSNSSSDSSLDSLNWLPNCRRVHTSFAPENAAPGNAGQNGDPVDGKTEQADNTGTIPDQMEQDAMSEGKTPEEEKATKQPTVQEGAMQEFEPSNQEEMQISEASETIHRGDLGSLPSIILPSSPDMPFVCSPVTEIVGKRNVVGAIHNVYDSDNLPDTVSPNKNAPFICLPMVSTSINPLLTIVLAKVINDFRVINDSVLGRPMVVDQRSSKNEKSSDQSPRDTSRDTSKATPKNIRNSGEFI